MSNLSSNSSRVLFCLTGSIACFKACQVVSAIVQAGCEVEVAVTPAALEFVGRATLEGLTGRPIFGDIFTPGAMMDHIRLARWCDRVVVCPATADSINRLAHGLANDVVGALFLAHDFSKPFIIVPAMNQAMWRHPATCESIAKLSKWGVSILEPSEGALACGETGPGRMVEAEAIIAKILG